MRCPYELKEIAEQLQWVGQTKLLLENTMSVEWNKQVGCYAYTGSLYWEGKADKISITIHNAPKPPLCKITETKEVSEHIVYKAECPEEVAV